MTSDKPVCVIVGMGEGIGLSVARRFAREGFAIGLIARRGTALDDFKKRFEAEDVPVAVAPADVGDAAGFAHALGKVTGRLGDATVLVFNAYALRKIPVTELSPEELTQDIAINASSALLATQAVLPEMRRGGGGTILITGGGYAFDPLPDLASLGAGKAALRNLAFSLNKALAEENIHVATVTVCGLVKERGSGGPFDPDVIADAYWDLHAEPRDSWRREARITE